MVGEGPHAGLTDAGTDNAHVRTFLIADIRGYTAFMQDHGDEAGARLADRFARIAIPALEARGGTGIQLRGDEALAVFTSPREAIRAALELQARFAEQTIADPALPLGVGIGLDAGEVVPLEDGYRGGAINLAARLCSMAGAAETLATREVVHLARRVDGVSYIERGTARLKGFADPVPVIRLAPEGSDPSQDLAYLRALGAVATPHAGALEMRNPYKGLRAFEEADAAFFFGREALTQELVSRAGEARFLAVVGPSGSGKSSVVRAGLVPAIRSGALPGSERWLIAEMIPGAHPLEELEASLLRIAVNPPASLIEQLEQDERGLLRVVKRVLPADDSELLLVIDQLEEVFTLERDEERRVQFLSAVHHAVTDPRSQVHVVTTLRADFYDRPLMYRGFADLLRSYVEALVPLSPEELERAIVGPAKAVDVGLEQGLLAEMVRDLADEPGALPLLQYALTELFDRREGKVLTREAYRDIGGVSGALGRRAEELFDELDQGGKEAARQLFLRLVTLGEGAEDTRRRVPRTEVASLEVDPQAMATVIDTFGASRQLSFDRDARNGAPTIELAHEALLTAWPRLRRWIDTARDEVRTERRVAAAAHDWIGADRDASFLLAGSRLEQAEAWRAGSGLALTPEELEFLGASVVERDRQRKDEEFRRARESALERRSVRRLRAFVAVLAVAALVAGALTVFATDQRGRAEQGEQVAIARELASAARANLGVDPERSLLLAIEAVEATRSSEGIVVRDAEEALHEAVVAQRVVASIPRMNSFDYSPDGQRLVAHPYSESGESGDAVILDAETGETLAILHGREGPLGDVALWDVDWSPKGDAVGTVAFDGVLTIWDPEDGGTVRTIRSAKAAGWLEFSPDGDRVAATGLDGVARVWDVVSGRLLASLEVNSGYEPGGLAWGPDGDELAVVTRDVNTPVKVFDVRSERLVWAGHGGFGWDVAWSPDDRVVLTSGDTVDVWNARTGDHLFSLFPPSEIVDLEFSPTGQLVAGGGADGATRVWEITRDGGREVLVLPSDAATICCVSFSPDGHRLAAGNGGFAAGDANVVGRIWDVSKERGGEHLTFPGGGGALAFSPDSSMVATNNYEGFTVWDTATGDRLRTFPADSFVTGIDFGPDGATIAASGGFGVAMWDVATGRERVRFDGHRGWVGTVDISSDGTSVVTTGLDDGTVRLWDATSGEELQILARSEATWFPGASLSPDGLFVATAEQEPGRIRLHDTSTGEIVEELSSTDAFGTSVEISPDGRSVAAGLGDGTLRVWMFSGRRDFSVFAHRGSVNSVAFDAKGSLLATGGEDGLVKVWDRRTGDNLLTLSGHTGEVAYVEFSPDGRILASSSFDGTVRTWILDLDELLTVARARVTRSLTDEECDRFLHLDRCPPR